MVSNEHVFEQHSKLNIGKEIIIFMKKLIGKRTTKVTKEAQARKIYESLSDEQKECLYFLLGKIACKEVKNFYSTKVYKNLVKDLDHNQRAVVAYICKELYDLNIFGDMEKLNLIEEK